MNKRSIRAYKNNRNIQLLMTIIFFIIGILGVYFGRDYIINKNNNINSCDGYLEVHYLDVDQGDAIYIKVNDYDILIDSGPKSQCEHLMSQLRNLNIDDFEMVIATHPHEDHIGGMLSVFNTYKVKAFYMPNVTNTTMAFENMINAVARQGLKINEIKSGMKFDLGEGAKLEVFSPCEDDYENLNDYSPIMKLIYGDNSFLFTGDAEKVAEEEVLDNYSHRELEADILKYGHHGSSTSSSEELIKAVSPKYGIISCGSDNNYGHPNKKVLKLIDKYDIETYRTDISGAITVISDGKDITIKTEK